MNIPIPPRSVCDNCFRNTTNTILSNKPHCLCDFCPQNIHDNACFLCRKLLKGDNEQFSTDISVNIHGIKYKYRFLTCSIKCEKELSPMIKSELGSIIDKNVSNKSLCKICNKPGDSKCARCKKIHYCSVECQKKDWPEHKKYCK
jgi:hypothetical protein